MLSRLLLRRSGVKIHDTKFSFWRSFAGSPGVATSSLLKGLKKNDATVAQDIVTGPVAVTAEIQEVHKKDIQFEVENATQWPVQNTAAGKAFAPKIVVVGVGGAGGNAVNNMIASKLQGVDFLVANTDAQHLGTSLTDNRIQLGAEVTSGLGCGANPAIGKQAAEAAHSEIVGKLSGANMVFVTAGMGGGTGTGAAPVIARAAVDAGILTVAVVTKPFHFEGSHRMALADAGLQELRDCVDTMIVIPNQNLFKMSTDETSFMDAFRIADDVLLAGVKNITDVMVMSGHVNLDFADVQTVMTSMGNAMMGCGEEEGEDRARKAAEAALCNPLLGDLNVNSASGMLVNITGGPDMTLLEVNEAAERVTSEIADPRANIIFGSTYDCMMEGKIRVSVVATGIDKTG